MAQTYYEVLGVADNATSAEIEAAFKRMAREVHPDLVPPGNTYLRKIAAEAFKDLSEAKTVLLDPGERRKYDAELAYMRGSETFYTAPQPSPAPSPPPPPRSQPSSASQAAPAPQQTQKYSFWQPMNTKFAISTLMAMAIGFVLLASGIAGSEQAANLGLAFIISGLGLLCWRHGSRPATDAAYLGGSVFLVIIAIIFFYAGLQSTPSGAKQPATTLTSTRVTTVAPQTSSCRTSDGKPCVDTRQTGSRANTTSKRSQQASAPASRAEFVVLRSGQRLAVTGYQIIGGNYHLQMKGGTVDVPAEQVLAIEPDEIFTPSRPRSETDPILEAIRSAGEPASNTSSTIDAKSQTRPDTGTNYTTKTWKSLKDGQIYRTHSKADTLYIETTDNYQNRTGDFISCEFQRAVSPGLSWTGFCWVRNPNDQSTYRSAATLATFSENRIEGSTTYIPNFVMIPAANEPQNSQVASSTRNPDPTPSRSAPKPPREFGTPDSTTTTRGRDLNSLTSSERASIESACSYAKNVQGPASYYRCLENQLSGLSTTPRHPDLSGLSSSEQYSIESACSYAKNVQGPASYYRCLQRQLDALSTAPRRPDLSGLSSSEQYSIESACSYAKSVQGPASYYRCLANQLESLKKYRQ